MYSLIYRFKGQKNDEQHVWKNEFIYSYIAFDNRIQSYPWITDAINHSFSYLDNQSFT